MSTRKLVDDYLHLGNRRRLVQHLRNRGIDDEAVLQAMAAVPRHWFVGQAYEDRAYEDRALPIAQGQTISQPYTVAYQTSLLQVKPRMKVLEVGTGSGYQAAILGKLGVRLYTLERQESLYQTTRLLLAAQRFGKIRTFLRDGYQGLPVYAPYDRILVTAGATEVPDELLAQLSIGGRLVIPVGDDVQVMQCVIRTSADGYRTEAYDQFRFVPFTEGVVPAN